MLFQGLPEWLQIPTETFNGLSVILATVQLLAIFFAAWNIKQQKKQITNLSHQVRLQTEQVGLQQKEVLVTSYAHFSNMYLKVMADIPDADANVTTKTSWWYRYWDILIAEVNFCMMGYLDKLIFGLWMNELGRNFAAYPNGAVHMGTFAENCEPHFDRVLPPHHPIRLFFDELRACAVVNDAKLRAEKIIALVEIIHNRREPDL
jgi:hypothetical protein